jgi:hypothetical protein
VRCPFQTVLAIDVLQYQGVGVMKAQKAVQYNLPNRLCH